MRTVTALFDTYDHAAAAVRAVKDAGIPSAVMADDIGGAYAGIAPARLLVAPEDAARARDVLTSAEAPTGEPDPPATEQD